MNSKFPNTSTCSKIKSQIFSSKNPWRILDFLSKTLKIALKIMQCLETWLISKKFADNSLKWSHRLKINKLSIGPKTLSRVSSRKWNKLSQALQTPLRDLTHMLCMEITARNKALSRKGKGIYFSFHLVIMRSNSLTPKSISELQYSYGLSRPCIKFTSPKLRKLTTKSYQSELRLSFQTQHKLQQ